MTKKPRVKRQRAQSVIMHECKTKASSFWHPSPFDKKNKFIPSSVDCLFNQEYFSMDEAANMLRSL
jgi:hypothetical protein